MRVLNLNRNELNYKKGIPKAIFCCRQLNTLLLENTGGAGYVFGGTSEDNQEDADDAEDDEEEVQQSRGGRHSSGAAERTGEEEVGDGEKNQYTLPALQVLSLAGNSFEGCVKKILQMSNNLRVLNLSNNRFDGTISTKWMEPLRGTIETLDLSYNRFGGLFFTPQRCQVQCCNCNFDSCCPHILNSHFSFVFFFTFFFSSCSDPRPVI